MVPNPQGARQLAIVAHSMGNRILTAALKDVQDAAAPVGQLLQTATIVFAAADVGRREFVSVLRETAAKPVSEHLRTVYRSNCDRALWISTFFNREGRVGCRLLLENEFETVDASQSSGRHPTKHGYWAQSPAVVADLRGVIVRGHAAPDRLHREGYADGTLRHCSCHRMMEPRQSPRHYLIHRHPQ